MKVHVGSKVTTPMPNGLMWPAIAISEETAETVTVTNRSTGLPVDIIVTRADFISKRTTRENVAYIAVTTEVVQYGYRPVAMPRLSKIEGLDVADNGKAIPLATLLEQHEVTYAEWQKGNFEARRGAVAAADL